ncbi:MAG TPA: cobalamin-independent methionine synthase II family protein [Trebonia sp.]|jgi:5-methyltetrahydropteroyltriglutamate--homocysteine methyltransferase|nr:cobalamin-independent methionine synthase II family protein [Trebonia sp.]
MATDIHAEHVGSLLRQPWLLAARDGYKRGALTEAELRAAEDRAALENIALQREAGIDVFTDGEVRRTNWMTGILESIGGMSQIETPSVVWRREDGEIPPREETDFVMTVATSKVFQKDHLTAVEAAFMASQVPGQFKITMMSAAMGGMTWRPEVSAAAYPDPAELVSDLVALQVAEISELAALGTRWVQLDSLSYNQVFDDEFRAATGNFLDPAAILDASVAADTAIVQGAKAAHPDITVGMHICRGNNRSAYMAKGSYEPVAEKLFGTVPVDRFLLEYDTERAGDFSPLRFMRPGAVVVLGLVSSKTPVLEPQDDLRRRIDEAARYVPMENLAISPQCGFASTSQGNVLTADEQKRKLELVVDTAQRVWG